MRVATAHRRRVSRGGRRASGGRAATLRRGVARPRVGSGWAGRVGLVDSQERACAGAAVLGA